MKIRLLPFILITGFIFMNSCKKTFDGPLVADQQFSVPENSPAGTVVGRVKASNASLTNYDTIFKYSITEGNSSNAFEISQTSGTITVQDQSKIDFETTPLFTLKVLVTNSMNKSASSHVTIDLEDVKSPAAGLILYYPFDGNLTDMGDSSNNAISFDTSGFLPGKWGQALNFNGTSDYIELSKTLNSTYGLCFSFWINSRGAAGSENNGAIISKYNMTSQERCFQIFSFGSGLARGDDRLGAAFYKYSYSSAYHDMTKSYLEPAELSVYPDPGLWLIPNPERLVKGEWTHCVVNLTTTTLEVWLDGVLCTKKIREYQSYFDSPYEPTYIGDNLAGGDGSNNHFNGLIDEFRVYNRTLSEMDITTLFREK